MVVTEEQILAHGRAFQQTLPPGLAWNQREDSAMGKLARGLAAAFATITARAQDLVDESDPRLAQETLGDWEANLGIPTECTSQPASTEARQALVFGKYVASGGQSIAHFVGVAADLGYTVEIEEHFADAFRAGESAAGDPVGSDACAFHWTVHAPPASPTFFTAGAFRSGDPIATASNDPLECTIAAIKPSHTIVGFEYDLPPDAGYTPWGFLAPGPLEVEAIVPHIALEPQPPAAP